MIGYIARDKDNGLYLYNHKPFKSNLFGRKCWDSDFDLFKIQETDLPDGINPQWEDEEPVKVCITISV